ncbi:sugar ABC transporter substrate-binding protein, partial [Faecalicatena contorta]
MKNMKKVLTLVLAGCMVFGLAGCEKEKASSVADSADNGSGKSDAEITIGYSFPGSNNEFWGTNALNSAKQAAEALGFKLIADDCNYDQAEQVSDVDSMISSGIDALVLAPQDASVCA